MTRHDILRVNLLLDLEKSVVVLLSPETADVIWLVGVGFILIGATVRSNFTQGLQQSSGLLELLCEEFGSVFLLVFGIEAYLRGDMPDSISL